MLSKHFTTLTGRLQLQYLNEVSYMKLIQISGGILSVNDACCKMWPQFWFFSFYISVSCFYGTRLWFLWSCQELIDGRKQSCSAVFFPFVTEGRIQGGILWRVNCISLLALCNLPTLGGIPQSSILSPSCQNVCGNSENMIWLKLISFDWD